MIRVTNLVHKYRGGERAVLNGVSFSLRRGEIVALVGKNGAGKSTVGKLVAGIIRPKKGTVVIDGIDAALNRNHEKVFAKVGIVFQNPETQIIFNDVYEEMKFACAKTVVSDAAIEDALKLVGMHGMKGELWDFSPGQKQRIVFAEMLARRPRYLVLDEPTAMIDSAGKRRIHGIIRDLKAHGIGILLITNSTEERKIADRTLILSEGKLKVNVGTDYL